MDSFSRLPSYQQYHNQNDTGNRTDRQGNENDDRENAAEIDPLLLRESIRNSLLETSKKNNNSTSSKRSSSSSSSSSSFAKARPISKQARTTALLVALLVLFLLAVLPHLPTADEMDLAREYELSWWNGLSRLRSAQHLADMNRLTFLGGGGHHHHDKLVTEIKDHNGAKHYLEPMNGCEATVVIVRHCEKGNIREHCAYVGFERSVYLATLFGDKDHERWPAPSYIFAQGPGQRRNERKMNFREIETVGPVAQKAAVKIDDSYTTRTVNHLAKQILAEVQTGQMCGKVTLISWKHSNIAHLAHHLGCGPAQGCPLDYRGKSFDNAWQIKFVYKQLEHSDRRDLKLEKHPEWHIFGSVQPEGFDPLAFSKQFGDYPRGGTEYGARWQKAKVAYPERESKNTQGGWKESRVGFDGHGGIDTPEGAAEKEDRKDD